MTKHKKIDFVGKVSVFIGKSCGYDTNTPAGFEYPADPLFDPTLNAIVLEIVMALCATAWLLSVGAVTQQQRHITVTVMELMVSKRIWLIMQKIAILISMVAVCGLAWSAWEPALHNFSYLERSGSAFNPPLPSYLKVLLFATCFLYFIQLLANLLSTHNDVGGE